MLCFVAINVERNRNSETINVQIRNLSYGKTSRGNVRAEEFSELSSTHIIPPTVEVSSNHLGEETLTNKLP